VTLGHAAKPVPLSYSSVDERTVADRGRCGHSCRAPGCSSSGCRVPDRLPSSCRQMLDWSKRSILVAYPGVAYPGIESGSRRRRARRAGGSLGAAEARLELAISCAQGTDPARIPDRPTHGMTPTASDRLHRSTLDHSVHCIGSASGELA